MASNRKTLSQGEVEQIFLKQGLQVLEPYKNSRTRIKAKCLECGKIVHPFYRQIWSGQSGCRDCSSMKAKLTSQNLKDTLNALSLRMTGEYKNSKTPLETECALCGYKSNVIIANIGKKKTFDCFGCNPKKAIPGSRRSLIGLELSDVREVFLQYQFELIGEYQSSKRNVIVKHLTCGTVSEKSLKNIKSGAGLCRGCIRNKPIAEDEALLILDAAGFEPLGKYINGDTPWEAKCKKCKRILNPTIHTLKSKKSGCAFCNKVRVDPEEAIAVMISAGYTPLVIYKNNRTKWKSRHDACGRIVYPMYNSIQTGQGGCTDCGDGYSYNEPSYFYVMEHESLGSLKIGISNQDSRDDRVLRHTKHGWKLVQRIDFENGFLAYEFEQTLLNHLRKNLNLPIHLSKSEMPQSGFTETLSVEFISLADLLKLVKGNQSGNLFM